MRVSVDVWCIDLVGAPPPSMADLDVLSAAERARHARYLVAEPARIFATTRIALRRLLAQRLGGDPSTIRIEPDTLGKPIAIDAPRAFFNVSHCATRALIAFCDVAPVGVDVEQRGAIAPGSPMAASVCTAGEAAWLDANPGLADAAIMHLWTRKEAGLKALGVGLTQPMSGLDSGNPAATEGVLAAPGPGRMAWRDLALPTGTVGAIAVLCGSVASIDATLRSWGPDGP